VAEKTRECWRVAGARRAAARTGGDSPRKPSRIVSRLHALCNKPLFFDGPDHRRGQARDLEEIATALHEAAAPEPNQGSVR
jgi:hypothetical protein